MSDPAGKFTVPPYSQIACIGTGLSVIALGVMLKRWYSLEDSLRCACDVPSALYSCSFHPNPRWTKLMPSYKEIKAYQDEAVEAYRQRGKMSFSTEVREYVWREYANLWCLTLLVEPRPCDIPGAETFRGAIFHSARWRHDVSLEGKKIVVLGKGCTAAQIVPAIVDKTESLHQIIRSRHWVLPAANLTYPPLLQWIFQFIPLATALHRLHSFLVAGNDFRLFPMTKAAAKRRESRRKVTETYMRETAPEKYHDLLIPDYDIAPGGLKTKNKFIPADVIILATGYQTNQFSPYMSVHGKEGTLEMHWKRYDGPRTYERSIISGFPNYCLLGLNPATGHTSALMAAEKDSYPSRDKILDGTATSVELKHTREDPEHVYQYKARHPAP
ncbi:hypothetical protein BDV37DRAFT_296024 [Aspergillus pseudonomiae]|uniref:L-ornithine N(5)-oxygenase n=1 Tax=Aspergillus pseudonomiae TaxID=1506151 RepID=A0A5N7DST6_9EURO|nr:uncharacterized protein BDV37DRAFT_296024 [Aspergillus pseudonomiae]KAE8408568.1 hypothetical protein BDV37DRAFT_296024 [Aspergillus pseudonomiae]